MSVNEFSEVLKKNSVQINGSLNENLTVGELGMDSFDIMMISFDLETHAGHELKLSLNDTICDVLRKVNNEV